MVFELLVCEFVVWVLEEREFYSRTKLKRVSTVVYYISLILSLFMLC